MLIETTLREGEQRFGVYFDPATRRGLAQGLARLGVEEIELGCVGCHDLAGLVRDLRAPGPGQGPVPALAAWCRLRESDLEAAVALGVDRVSMGAPVSDGHLAKRLGLSRRKMLGRLRACLGLARDLGLAYVSVGLEDVSRADRDFVLEAAAEAVAAGAARVRLADTVGLFSPLETMDLVRGVRQALGANGLAADLAAHCHDDLGMGTANAVSALVAGADFVDGSLLGLGERAGLAATEELAAWLVLRQGRAYRLDLVRELCALAARASGMAVPAHKAVAGQGLFACESGVHAHGLARDPALFEPFAPQAVGGRASERCLAVGKKSGRASVELAVSRLGLAKPGPDAPALALAVRERSALLNRPLSDEEFIALHGKTVWRATC